MAIRKSNEYLSLANSYMIDSPQPTSLNYWWNLGSLLGLCLLIQIASGVFLAMHYSSHTELAFDSVEHIMRDVNGGWFIRYVHANGASFFFICMYMHIGKALYYGSYKAPRFAVWALGVVILILTIAIGFLGYLYNSPKSLQYTSSNSKYISYNSKYKSLQYISPNNKYKSYFSKHSLLYPRYLSYSTNSKQDITDCNNIFNELNLNVVQYWDNLHDHNIRNDIILNVKNKSGIYIIINKISRNYYIGSSINKLYTRFSRHLLNFNGSKILKNAVKKDGLNNFIYAIIEFTPDNDNQNNLYELEIMYIGMLMPKYNILTETKNSINYKYTEESILKLKNSFTKERRIALANFQNVRKNNLIISQKQTLHNIALLKPKDYIANKDKNKISFKHSVNILLYNENNEYLCEFYNLNKASHYLCCSYKTIQRALNIGHIYIPNIFNLYLNNKYILNNEDIISNINRDNKYYLNNRGKLIKIKSGLINTNWNTLYKIKRG